jgi:PAS domain S-box-containing protein
MHNLELLLVEDDEDDAALVVDRLRRSGLQINYRRVQTAAALSTALRALPPDLVISDNGMPSFNAETALEILHDTDLDVPFIVVSGQIGEEAAAALMRAGAHDFVLKDNLTRLAPAIQRELRDADDRHERRQAQAALRTAEDRFRLISEHLQDVVFRFRPGTAPALEYISPAISKITGHYPAQLYTDPDLIFQTVETADRSALRQSWQEPPPPSQPLTTRWRRPDGTVAWIEQRLATVHQHDSDDVAVEGVLRDITNQIQATHQREELERQLHQAERLDSLGQLAGGIAHDFNNLLGVITGYAAFVLDELPTDHPCRTDIDNIDQAARRGAALTRQLLIFSRLQPTHPEQLDLNHIVTEIERLLRRTIGEDIDFVLHTQPNLDNVTIDGSRLEQIVMNLVVNARAAMPDGGRLTIETTIIDDQSGPPTNIELPAGRLVCLTVADTGCGMTAEVKRRAFEPFFTTKGVGQGSGLGLATVYGAVNEAGGKISVWSEPGHGTRISIYLPSAGPHTQPSSTATPADDLPSGQGECVLVVEDDDAIREIARRILSRHGYHVMDASTRDEALRTIQDNNQNLDLLVSDVVMPGLSATEFIDAVRKARPTLPLVLISGYTAETNRSGTPLPDDLPVVGKPFNTNELLAAVYAALHQTTEYFPPRIDGPP